MNARKEQLKQGLEAMVAGRGDGIDLDTASHWLIKGLKQPGPFFQHLPDLLPAGAILYVEGTSIAADVARVYKSHHAHNAVAVVRDTIFPPPDIYHFDFSVEVCRQLRCLAESHAVPEMFNHLKAYREQALLFTFHDAFDGWLLISEYISEAAVSAFCRSLNVSYERAETKHRDPELLAKLLDLLHDPDAARKIRFQGEPWWRRILRQLTGRF